MFYILGSWDGITFIQNLHKYVGTAGSLFLTFLGLVLVIVSGFKMWRNFVSDNNQRQPKWGMTIAGLMFGGVLLTSGSALLIEIARGGQKTLEDMGTGGGFIHMKLLLDQFLR